MTWQMEERKPITHWQAYHLLLLLIKDQDSDFWKGLTVLYPELPDIAMKATYPFNKQIPRAVAESRDQLAAIIQEIAEALTINKDKK